MYICPLFIKMYSIIHIHIHVVFRECFGVVVNKWSLLCMTYGNLQYKYAHLYY